MSAGIVNPVGRIERRRNRLGWLPDDADIVTAVCNRHERKGYLNRVGHSANMVRRRDVRLAAAGLVAQIFQSGKQALVFTLAEYAQAGENRQPRNVDNVPVFVRFQIDFDDQRPFLSGGFYAPSYFPGAAAAVLEICFTRG